MHKVRALLSDSDGTLVDTVNLIRHGQFEAAHTYLTNHGIPAAELPDYPTYEAALHRVVGGRTRDTIEQTVRLLYDSQPHRLQGVDFDELYSLLDPIQDRLAPTYIKAFDGLGAMLRALGSANIKMAIFSSGDRRMIVRNLGLGLPELGLTDLYLQDDIPSHERLNIFVNALKIHFGLPDFTVVTSDDTIHHKPDPEGLQLAMHRLHITPEEAAVMGDHRYDMMVGINSDVPRRIGITHGFSSSVELREAGATHIVDQLTQVPIMLAA